MRSCLCPASRSTILRSVAHNRLHATELSPIYAILPLLLLLAFLAPYCDFLHKRHHIAIFCIFIIIT